MSKDALTRVDCPSATALVNSYAGTVSNRGRACASSAPSDGRALIVDRDWWIGEGSKDNEATTRVIVFHGEFVGLVGITPQTGWRDHLGEIGYWLGTQYWGKGIATSALKQMTDHEVFHRFNEGLKASRLYRKAHPYVAKEVPKGKQQLHRQYHRGPFELQGDVLRCIIGVKNDGEVVFEIDNKELNASEFSSLFHAHAGWGLRVCVVPADELSREPRIEVLAPKGTRR